MAVKRHGARILYSIRFDPTYYGENLLWWFWTRAARGGRRAAWLRAYNT